MEQPPVTEERLAVDEFEPGVHLSVADGFRFGCGFVLAGIGFYFAVIVIGALALAAAGLLGSPISLNSLLGWSLISGRTPNCSIDVSILQNKLSKTNSVRQI